MKSGSYLISRWVKAIENLHELKIQDKFSAVGSVPDSIKDIFYSATSQKVVSQNCSLSRAAKEISSGKLSYHNWALKYIRNE